MASAWRWVSAVSAGALCSSLGEQLPRQGWDTQCPFLKLAADFRGLDTMCHRYGTFVMFEKAESPDPDLDVHCS